MFYDRKEAGTKLALQIKNLKIKIKKDDSVILALPRGGVIVGAEVAKILGLPLDIIVVRKIGHPSNPEYAVAACGLQSEIIGREPISREYLEKEIEKEREEIRRRLKEYRKDKKKPNLFGKRVILVDDGLATGLTMKAAIEEVKREKPKEIIVAVPVAPAETISQLKEKEVKIICLEVPSPFFAIGNFYQRFEQVTDKEVKEVLKNFDKK